MRSSTLVVCAALVSLCQGQEAESKAEKGEKTRKELAEGLSFCEYDDCYELLGVKKTSALPAIKRAYRKLAAEWHPDKCPGGNIPKCRELFPKYANAYEVLASPEMRKNYDYVLDNPYEFPAFWMKYSRPQYASKTDLRAVFLITLLAAAGVQYFLKKQMYEQALGSIKKDPRSNYQMRLKELMSKSGPPSPSKKSSGAQRGEANSTKSKSTPKAEELEKRKKEAEAQLELELAEQLPPPPALLDNVAVSVFKLPLTLTYTALWVASGGMREPGYRTRRALGMTAAEWDALDEADRAEYLELELWVSENMLKYEEELKEAKRLGNANKTGKEKRAARDRKRQLRDPSAMQLDD